MMPSARTRGRKRPRPSVMRPWDKAWAVPREAGRVGQALLRHWYWEWPETLARSLWSGTGLEKPLSRARLAELAGDVLLGLFDDLGPIYGKAAQTALSRMPDSCRRLAEDVRLDRLYGDWPPLPFTEVQAILDREIPGWRAALTLEARPLGVASMAQVHGAVDRDGRAWVVKIIKPRAAARLMETVEAMEQVLALMRRLPLTRAMARLVRESGELCAALRLEADLGHERKNIERARESVGERRTILRIPAVNEAFCGKHVLTLERFHGVRFSDLVAARAELPAAERRKLARRALGELLVQVFEDGIFHADPHAGNLMLLDDGGIGLFDWGLTGELSASDRRHIAAVLKAVLAMRLDRLVDALVAMADAAGQSVHAVEVERALKELAAWALTEDDDGKRPGFGDLMEACLTAAETVGIAVPDGLLLMAKSLLTIEGLAKGLDPDVAFARVAAPVLFRAAKPGVRDFVDMGKSLPKLAKRWWARGQAGGT